jgi:hypothetical protein
MTLEKIFEKLDEHEIKGEEAKPILLDFFKFKNDRYLKMAYNKHEYCMRNELQLDVCDTYAYMKTVEKYELE